MIVVWVKIIAIWLTNLWLILKVTIWGYFFLRACCFHTTALFFFITFKRIFYWKYRIHLSIGTNYNLGIFELSFQLLNLWLILWWMQLGMWFMDIWTMEFLEITLCWFCYKDLIQYICIAYNKLHLLNFYNLNKVYKMYKAWRRFTVSSPIWILLEKVNKCVNNTNNLRTIGDQQ